MDKIACFETILTLILNWTREWFQYFPAAPLLCPSLAFIEECVFKQNPRLYDILTSHFSINVRELGWVLVSTFFSEAFGRVEWMQFTVSVVERVPKYFYAAAAGYICLLAKDIQKIMSESSVCTSCVLTTPKTECSKLEFEAIIPSAHDQYIRFQVFQLLRQPHYNITPTKLTSFVETLLRKHYGMSAKEIKGPASSFEPLPKYSRHLCEVGSTRSRLVRAIYPLPPEIPSSYSIVSKEEYLKECEEREIFLKEKKSSITK
ncbi:hypothetical protein ADUPG1_013446 [Aduncisulcus paluster]|uniref:Uncharacterized protein n=1 Tax=Aduncisulcus paluster TaxID=2918883 RepID=A0ABQ5K7Q8_9EUKA|nr:hypothetical protein ADUPG1_013446 [Aduncisulcus paluster]